MQKLAISYARYTDGRR